MNSFKTSTYFRNQKHDIFDFDSLTKILCEVHVTFIQALLWIYSLNYIVPF